MRCGVTYSDVILVTDTEFLELVRETLDECLQVTSTAGFRCSRR
jgi:hypothetical protein